MITHIKALALYSLSDGGTKLAHQIRDDIRRTGIEFSHNNYSNLSNQMPRMALDGLVDTTPARGDRHAFSITEKGWDALDEYRLFHQRAESMLKYTSQMSKTPKL